MGQPARASPDSFLSPGLDDRSLEVSIREFKVIIKSSSSPFLKSGL